MNIYQARIKDLLLIKEMVDQTINEIYPHYYPMGAVSFFISHHNKTNITKDLENGCVFCATDDKGNYVGTITIKGNEICRLFVLPIYQKLGYGTKLMQFAEERIFGYADSIMLDASLPAKNMYIKRGYVGISSHSIKTENEDMLYYDVMQKNYEIYQST